MKRLKEMVLFVLMVGIFLGQAQFSFAQEGAWDYYEINAQYRGGMKKGFDQLGCGLAFYSQLGDGRKQVIFHACVKDPQKRDKYYAFRLNMVYSSSQNGGKVEQDVYSWFDGFDPRHQQQVKDMILFLAMVKDGTLVNASNKDIAINNTAATVKSVFVGGGKRHEYSTNRPGNPPIDGKFFSKVDGKKQLVLEKFHLRRGKVSVSFVCVPLAQIQGKFQSKTPFNKVVFAK